jgi:bifunctional non-homologous end joining protein LigD
MTATDRPDPATLLARYNEMRDFEGTPEPAGEGRPRDGHLRFVVQKHDASQLHYDFRIEIDGVLKSWSIPKGPSLNPTERRLAMATEDHPLAYAAFEGHIPEGHYGAGDMIIWDRGVYFPQDKQLNRIPEDEAEDAAAAGYAAGEIKFELAGVKLRGSWAIVRMKGRGEGNWLLIKHNDEFADRALAVADQKQSVVSGALLPRDMGGPTTAQRRASRKRSTGGDDS